MNLLNQIDSDPARKMTAAECLEAIHDNVARFDAVLSNPAVFEANSPHMDAEDYIALHESFYLLEPMEERWGKWVGWRCMCESFFGNGIHSHHDLARPTLTSCTAVVWPSSSSPPPGTRLVITAIVQAQRPTPRLGTDVHIPARGM